MQKIKSCGVILFREDPFRSFLLMKRRKNFDLPKGHIEQGESETECALRELYEETGITKEQIFLDDKFRFTSTYYPKYKRFQGAKVDKTVVIFLAWLRSNNPIQLSEHDSSEWVNWAPPHRLQRKTIDPLLKEVQHYFIKKEVRND